VRKERHLVRTRQHEPFKTRPRTRVVTGER
jgi:hypothetical protein